MVESMFYTVKPNKYWRLAKLLRLKEKYDSDINGRKEKKNEIMKRVAAKKGVKYLDINQYMIKYGKRYYHRDHIHYEDSAREFIVNEMIRALA